jgi:hypothetical protein
LKVGIIQSNYIPWRGYFDFIDSVDLFIIYDDVQYPVGRSWRNRNQIKTEYGLKWLTVPIRSEFRLKKMIDQVEIGQSNKPWQETHHHLLNDALKRTLFFKEVVALWEEGISHNDTTISQLNIRLIKLLCHYLQIDTPLILSRDYAVTGAKTERLINLLKKVGATVYLSGPSAKGYLDENLFRENNISLEYKTYEYKPYPQLWGDFVGNVTVLDLIANTGPEARQFIRSLTPNQVVIS